MARVKRGVEAGRKHKQTLALAKGYRGARSRSVRRAHEAILHAGDYAFAGRKNKKRDLRRLWITRISAATKRLGVSYSDFISGLRKNKIGLNRKMLADLVVNDFETFRKVVLEANEPTRRTTSS